MSESKKRIIVIDDDKSILRVFKNILEKAGYVVQTAETGKEAVEKLEKETFDVCLIDVRLPDVDGTEILKMVKSPETVKIIVTGFSSEEDGKKAADYGADDYLVKPVKSEELLAAVRERLEARNYLIAPYLPCY